MDNKNVASEYYGVDAKKDNNFINTINGNVVHVTVNNFITTDKKPL